LKRDFLSIADYSREEIEDIFQITKDLKDKTKSKTKHHLCDGLTMSMIFAKPSARTRISFETGMYQLGGYALYLSPNDIGIGKREAVKDIAQVISRYNDIIMARLFQHQHIVELAAYATVPVINGLTDYNHPCQIMADMYTVKEHFNRIEDLKIVYVGDGNNVANSWINFAAKFPMHLKKVFMAFQINDELMKHANPNAKVMHCLPAHRGDEITDSVVDGPQSIVFDEAENRMHVQKAIIVKLLGKA